VERHLGELAQLLSARTACGLDRHALITLTVDGGFDA